MSRRRRCSSAYKRCALSGGLFAPALPKVVLLLQLASAFLAQTLAQSSAHRPSDVSPRTSSQFPRLVQKSRYFLCVFLPVTAKSKKDVALSGMQMETWMQHGRHDARAFFVGDVISERHRPHTISILGDDPLPYDQLPVRTFKMWSYLGLGDAHMHPASFGSPSRTEMEVARENGRFHAELLGSYNATGRKRWKERQERWKRSSKIEEEPAEEDEKKRKPDEDEFYLDHNNLTPHTAVDTEYQHFWSPSFGEQVECEYYLKADPDSYVNVPKIIERLQCFAEDEEDESENENDADHEDDNPLDVAGSTDTMDAANGPAQPELAPDSEKKGGGSKSTAPNKNRGLHYFGVVHAVAPTLDTALFFGHGGSGYMINHRLLMDDVANWSIACLGELMKTSDGEGMEDVLFSRCLRDHGQIKVQSYGHTYTEFVLNFHQAQAYILNGTKITRGVDLLPPPLTKCILVAHPIDRAEDLRLAHARVKYDRQLAVVAAGLGESLGAEDDSGADLEDHLMLEGKAGEETEIAAAEAGAISLPPSPRALLPPHIEVMATWKDPSCYMPPFAISKQAEVRISKGSESMLTWNKKQMRKLYKCYLNGRGVNWNVGRPVAAVSSSLSSKKSRTVTPRTISGTGSLFNMRCEWDVIENQRYYGLKSGSYADDSAESCQLACCESLACALWLYHPEHGCWVMGHDEIVSNGKSLPEEGWVGAVKLSLRHPVKSEFERVVNWRKFPRSRKRNSLRQLYQSDENFRSYVHSVLAVGSARSEAAQAFLPDDLAAEKIWARFDQMQKVASRSSAYWLSEMPGVMDPDEDTGSDVEEQTPGGGWGHYTSVPHSSSENYVSADGMENLEEEVRALEESLTFTNNEIEAQKSLLAAMKAAHATRVQKLVQEGRKRRKKNQKHVSILDDDDVLLWFRALFFWLLDNKGKEVVSWDPYAEDEEEDDCCCFAQNSTTQLYVTAFVMFFLAVCGGIVAAALGSQRCCGSAWTNEDHVSLACSAVYRSCYDVTRAALGVGMSAVSLLLIGFIMLGIACHCGHQRRMDKKAQRRAHDRKYEYKREQLRSSRERDQHPEAEMVPPPFVGSQQHHSPRFIPRGAPPLIGPVGPPPMQHYASPRAVPPGPQYDHYPPHAAPLPAYQQGGGFSGSTPHHAYQSSASPRGGHNLVGAPVGASYLPGPERGGTRPQYVHHSMRSYNTPNFGSNIVPSTY
eukprot:g2095.t1